jgi:hypothetical protein
LEQVRVLLENFEVEELDQVIVPKQIEVDQHFLKKPLE